MYYRLAIKNLLSQKTRTILTSAGISIGIASLVLLLALSEGLKQTVFRSITRQSPLNQITVQSSGRGGLLKLLPGQQSAKITPEILQKIQKISHVASVFPEMNYANISSLQIGVFGQIFQTDAMIFGIPYDFLEEDFKKSYDVEQWNTQKEPYPAVISRRLIDLYNLTVSPTNNLPTFSEKDLLGREMTVLLDYSTFFAGSESIPKNYKVKVVGFSDKVSLVGITLPIGIIKRLNQEHDANYQESYLRLFVTVDEAQNVEQVRQEIQNMGLDTFSILKEVQVIEGNFKIITLGLTFISFIILLVSGFMIANIFLASINERKSEIGIFRALGATRLHILKMFLTEASLLGLISGVVGIFFGWGCSLLLNKYALDALPNISAKPEILFIIDPYTLVFVLLFSVGLSVFFAFIPSAKASRLQPLEALRS